MGDNRISMDACRQSCAKRCIHAESKALKLAMVAEPDGSPDWAMIHVKIDADGNLVADGGPSCWQCSREILDAEIAGIWLFEARETDRWIFYDSLTFHRVTMAACNIS